MGDDKTLGRYHYFCLGCFVGQLILSDPPPVAFDGLKTFSTMLDLSSAVTLFFLTTGEAMLENEVIIKVNKAHSALSDIEYDSEEHPYRVIKVYV